jgi:hypothetical protein
VPEVPGLGIELDLDALEAAQRRYQTLTTQARDDAAAMQFLIADWRFDPKRPALVR